MTLLPLFRFPLLLVRALAPLSFCLVAASPVSAQDLFVGNRAPASVGVAGADIASPHGALSAASGNPAGLASLEGRSLEVGGLAIFGHGTYASATSSTTGAQPGRMEPLLGAAPTAAFVTGFGASPWRLSLSATPDTSLAATWYYNDAPGTAGVTYGYQRNKSSFLNERFAAGVARPLGHKVFAGATFGVIYNSTNLVAPTIFQHQPVLAGLKTLLNLQTSGFGINGTAGVIVAPSSKLQLAFSYKSPTTINTSGVADGNLSALLAALGLTGSFRPDFHYAADLRNTLPQTLGAGLTWNATSRTRIYLRGDYVNWRNSFDHLALSVHNGNNADLNGLVGADNFKDTIPLEWRNQGIFHAGIETPVTRNLLLRGGYIFANNPVPSSTLTPLTAAITRQTLAAGAGYHRGRYSLDLGYQAGLPQTESVDISDLRAGEYNNSSTELSTQTVAASLSTRF